MRKGDRLPRTAPDALLPQAIVEKTAKGIGLGSKESELKRAYHGLEKQVVIPGLTLYTIKGPKEIATIFTVGATSRVTGITVESHPGG